MNFESQLRVPAKELWRLLGLSIPTLIFVYLAIAVWRHPTAFDWDRCLLLAIHKTAQPQLDQVAHSLTKLGVYWGVVPAVIGLSVMFLIRRQWRSLTYLLVTYGGTAIINITAKAFFHRVRPHLWETAADKTSFAFPSGHAMSSMALVMTLIILLWGTRWSVWVLVSGSVFLLTIAWTRLYLGVHYPSDIVAGWMIALVWAIAVSWIVFPAGAASGRQDAVLPAKQYPRQSQVEAD